MSEPTIQDVLDRLDAIEGRIDELEGDIRSVRYDIEDINKVSPPVPDNTLDEILTSLRYIEREVQRLGLRSIGRAS